MSERYTMVKLLGEGSYGKCFLVQAQSNNHYFVIKQIQIKHMDQLEKEETMKEASILRHLDHPYIVRLQELYISKKGKLCIVMDYADGGDLNALIKAREGQKFTENQILTWFVQISLALKHVHDRKILHRDLKSQNIFLMKDGTIKLGDFGIAKVLNQTMDNAKTMVGTPFYLSPELIDSKPYNFKSDIWSLGVLLYEMCQLEPPFVSNSIHGLALKIVRGVYPPIGNEYSRDLKILIASLLAVDPKQRPNINEILKSPMLLLRVQSLLTDAKFQEEFSHTVIHNTHNYEERPKTSKKISIKHPKSPGIGESKAERPSTSINKNIKNRLSPDIDQPKPQPDKKSQANEIGSVKEDDLNGSEDTRKNNIEKIEQFRDCLIDMMGSELFEDAYSIIKKHSYELLENPDADFKVFEAHLSHLMSRKNLKKFIPMLQALIEMELQ